MKMTYKQLAAEIAKMPKARQNDDVFIFDPDRIGEFFLASVRVQQYDDVLDKDHRFLEINRNLGKLLP